MRRWTFQELLAVAYPSCVVSAAVLLLSVYCVEQNMTSMLYSSLPDSFKTPSWFILCLLQEANQLTYGLSFAFVVQLHILLPNKLSWVLQSLADNNSGSGMDQSKIINQIRIVQLAVNLFNIGHRNIIYCVKLTCITIASIDAYAAIAHGEGNTIFALVASNLTLNMVLLYAFVYQKAFMIPDGVKKVKNMLQVGILTCRDVKYRKYLRGRINSVPQFGLKVGDFHMLERASTPVFIDYVVKNVVNLLVTF